MPEITDITAIRVVVAKMIPSSVRKLRSLLPRNDWTAPVTASQNDACVLIQSYVARPHGLRTAPHSLPGRRRRRVHSGSRQNPLHYRRIHPKPVRAAADEPEVSAIFGGDQLDVRIRLHGLRFENSERNERIVFRLDEQGRD